MRRDVVDGADPAAAREAVQTAPSRRWGRLAPSLSVLTVLATVGLVAAACGGSPSAVGVASITTTASSSSGGSHATGSTGGEAGGASSGGSFSGGVAGPAPGGAVAGGSISSTGPEAQQLAFAKCMRANGVPNFPDPNGQGQITFNNINPNSSQFQKAQNKCGSLQRGGPPPSPAQQAQQLAQALKFSQCMRSHGITDFPDPQSVAGGGIRIAIRVQKGQSGASDLDPNSPIFQKAQQVCQGLLPGGGPAKRVSSNGHASGGSGS